MDCLRARIRKIGGPNVIEWVEELAPHPGPNEVLIEQTAVGVNYIDTYHRGGLYPVPLPSGLGLEAAGRVIAIGDGVNDYAAGDRVAYMGPGLGAYASHRVMSSDDLFRLPEEISEDQAAATILKAATTEALVERCANLNEGDTALVHAAAGGVGLIMVQWLKALNVRVIGTVSSDYKEVAALEAGCDFLIRYDREDVASNIREITNGEGVPVVFDGVGRDTFNSSLDSLSPRGLLVSYGNASGAVEGVNLGTLAQKGSVFVTRPTLFHYYQTKKERQKGIARVWEMIKNNHVKVTIGQSYDLTDAMQAHIDLEARVTTGSTILKPYT